MTSFQDKLGWVLQTSPRAQGSRSFVKAQQAREEDTQDPGMEGTLGLASVSYGPNSQMVPNRGPPSKLA